MVAGRWARARPILAGCLVALMVASLFCVGAPRANAQAPQQVTFGLEGCRITPGITLPINGQFVCPDNLYTSGSLGPNWSELDLVPYRLTADNRGPAQTYTVAVAADFEDGGVRGFDVVSVPVLNQGLSDSTCRQPVVGPQTVRQPGVGGADASVYRNLTITQAAGEYCVYDYTLRLALGAADFPGASLSGRFGSENFAGSNQNVGVQTNALDPQQLSKSIEAARGNGFLWTVNKSSIPSQLSVDTCLDNPAATFLSTITWTRTPVTGDVTWTSSVLASNPSNRALFIQVTDVVSADGVQVDTTTGNRVLLPAGAVNYPVLVHAGTAPANTQTISDTASATYIDTVTDQPIPERTTATASAPVLDNPPGNATAKITDVTISTGAPVSIDATRSETNPGTTNVPFGQPVTTPITWDSGTITESGAATLAFTAHLDDAFNGRVAVRDTATLVDRNGDTETAVATVSVDGNPAAPTITFVKTVDLPPTEDADFRFGLWFAGQDPTTDPPIISGPVTIPAGMTQSESIAIDVPPSPNGYIYVEEPPPGYVGLGNGVVPPLGLCDTFEGEVANERLFGTLTIVKEVQGDPSGADATATVVVDCPGTNYDQTLRVSPGTPVETDPIPSGTRCTITEPTAPPGYQRLSITPSEPVVPADDTVTVTVTNTRQTGELVVTKVIVGAVAGASTTFPIAVNCDADAYDEAFNLTVPGGATEVSSAPLEIPVGVTCTVTESPVPNGWGLTSITPNNGVVTIVDDTSEVTLTNTRASGGIVVNKVAPGDPDGTNPIFTIAVNCTNGFSDEVTLDLSDDGAAAELVGPIPSGVTCTVTEPTTPDGWSRVGIEPTSVVIGTAPATPVSVTVTNERDLGTIAVEKVVEGDPAGSDPTASIRVDCPGTIYDQTLTVPPGETVETGQIPTLLECAISEPNPPPGWDVTIDPDTVVVQDGTPVQVTVTNTRQTGELVVTKVIVGAVAGASTTFPIAVNCDADAYDEAFNLTVPGGATEVSSAPLEIPVGVTCTVTESPVPNGWGLTSITPNNGVVTIVDDTSEVTLTNTRLAGSLVVNKVAPGDPDGTNPIFTIAVNCTNGFSDEVTLDLSDDGAAAELVGPIPSGVTCTVTEPTTPDGWSRVGIEPTSVVIGTAPATPVSVTVTNERDLGTIAVEKVVEGDPAGSDPTASIRVDCPGTIYDQTLTVPPGETVETGQIPTLLECAISEPNPPPGWDVTIDPDTVVVQDGTPVQVTVTNTRQTGELVVTKVIVGAVAGASTTFPIAVNCDADAYDEAFNLTVPGGATEVSSAPLEIPVGVTCTVTESPVPNGWGLTSITPNNGVVTIVDDTSEVTLTNTRASGGIVVNKVAPGDPDGTNPIFTIAVNCTNGFSDEVTLDLSDDGAAAELVGPIPSGVTCTVTEPTTPDGWSRVGIEPTSVVIGTAPATPVSVTVTNERDLGTIAVEKVVEGDPAGSDPTASIRVDCPGTIYDQTLTVPPGETVETGQIPTLLECAISEPNPPPGWDVTIDPDTVVVQDGTPVQVTVTNTRQTGEITVVKRLSGPVAGADTEFTLALNCDQDQFDRQVDVEVTNGESVSATIDEIPTGTICSLTEPEASEAWELASITPSQVVVGEEPVSLVAVNRRLTGGLEIFKYLLGPVDGAPTTFSAFLNCDGTAFDQDVVIEVTNGISSRTVIPGIPTGVTCTAEEVQVPEQWSLGGVASGTVTITDTELIPVHVVNTRVTGELTVVKAVEGDPSDSSTSFDLVLDCDDDLFDTAVPVDLPAGDTAVSELFSGIPTGVICSVTEEALPNDWKLVSVTPAQTEIAEAEPAVVTVLNRFAPPSAGPPVEYPTSDHADLADTGSLMSLTDLLLLLTLGGLAVAAGLWMITASRRKP